MRIAVITDIHGNYEALQACLAQAARAGADRLALLGDFVGYGAEPGRVVATVMELQAQGALVVRGNHEAALTGNTEGFNPQAKASALWTRDRLDDTALTFLARLPLVERLDWVLFAHASARDPERWTYLDSTRAAADCIAAYPPGVRLGVFGHVHRQALYYQGERDPGPGSFQPRAGAEVRLGRMHRWAALAGSAGQPRDGNPAAAWLLVDLARERLTFHRVSYDIDLVAQQILAAGLPPWFAQRLSVGS